MNILEKILEEITQPTKYTVMCGKHFTTIDRVEKIIHSHMDEVPVDWIPVSERLPKVPEGTEDEYCPEFNVTIKDVDKATTLKFAPDGTWFDNSGEVYSVIAWQPLPEGYKGE